MTLLIYYFDTYIVISNEKILLELHVNFVTKNLHIFQNTLGFVNQKLHQLQQLQQNELIDH